MLLSLLLAPSPSTLAVSKLLDQDLLHKLTLSFMVLLDLLSKLTQRSTDPS